MGDLGDATIAELRAIRALWYSILLDTHGNVPLLLTFQMVPEQATRLSNIRLCYYRTHRSNAKLGDKNDINTYGRMNKWAAYGFS